MTEILDAISVLEEQFAGYYTKAETDKAMSDLSSSLKAYVDSKIAELNANVMANKVGIYALEDSVEEISAAIKLLENRFADYYTKADLDDMERLKCL